MDKRIWLRVDDADPDEQHLEELALMLRRELVALGAAVERPSAGAAPEGARAVEWAAIGALLVTIAGSPVLASLIDAVSAWLGDRRQRKVLLEVDGDRVELTGAPTEEERAATQRWVRRHGAARRSALIVANSDYSDPGLGKLRAPAHDAERLAGVLGDPRIGGFGVRTLLDQPASVINEAVEDFFADRDADDLLLLHFSGHGIKDESGELYFAASGTKLNRLGGTAVAADYVTRLMNRSRSRRIVLLLDCCYSGAFARGMVARAGATLALDEQFGGTGRAVITASSAVQYAFEGLDLADSRDPGPSVFTSALVEGLDSGDADRDQDGFVGLDELYEYVYDRVRRVTPNQTPGMWVLDLQGDLRIARRARPVTTPSDLPEEVRHALEHPLPGVRAGVINDLVRLAESAHAGLALAGKQALERLADDDSRTVAARAAEALGTPAPPRPEPAPAPREEPAPAPPPPPAPGRERDARQQARPNRRPPRTGRLLTPQTATVRQAPAQHPLRRPDYLEIASRLVAVGGLFLLAVGGAFTGPYVTGGFGSSRGVSVGVAAFDVLAVWGAAVAAGVLVVATRDRWRDVAHATLLGLGGVLFGALVLAAQDDSLYSGRPGFSSWPTAYGVVVLVAAAVLDAVARGRVSYPAAVFGLAGVGAMVLHLNAETPTTVFLVALLLVSVVLAAYRGLTHRRLAVIWSPLATGLLVMAAGFAGADHVAVGLVVVVVAADVVLGARADAGAVVKVIAAIGVLAHDELGSGDLLDVLPHTALVVAAGLLACCGVRERSS